MSGPGRRSLGVGGWWRAHGVRLRLTLWYLLVMILVLAVYDLAVFAFISRGLSETLNQRLRGDFQWAAAMVDRTPEGRVTWYQDEAATDDERPWLQVWSIDGELLYRNIEAELRPAPGSGTLAFTSEERPVTVSAAAPLRLLSRRSYIGSQPVMIQVARSEAPMRAQRRELVLIFVFGLPAAAAAAGLGGYVLAGRALAPLEESFARMRRFTADVSHELRTPLTSIRSVGEVGLRSHRDAQGYRGIIGSMLEEADRLASLVDRLLTLSRAETGEARLSIEPIDLRALAEDVASHLGVLAEEQRQTVSIETAGAPQALGDRTVIRQALINLVDNAIKFSGSGGTIRIGLLASAGSAIADVHDSGPGVAADARERIFDRFYRGGTSATGAGLGLSIARGAVEANGGRLTLHATGPAGSTFRIALPATAAAAPRTAGDPGAAATERQYGASREQQQQRQERGDAVPSGALPE